MTDAAKIERCKAAMARRGYLPELLDVMRLSPAVGFQHRDLACPRGQLETRFEGRVMMSAEQARRMTALCDQGQALMADAIATLQALANECLAASKVAQARIDALKENGRARNLGASARPSRRRILLGMPAREAAAAILDIFKMAEVRFLVAASTVALNRPEAA